SKITEQNEEYHTIAIRQTTVEQTLKQIENQFQTFDQQLSTYDGFNSLENRVRQLQHDLISAVSTDDQLNKRMLTLVTGNNEESLHNRGQYCPIKNNFTNSDVLQQTSQTLNNSCSVRMQTYSNEKSKTAVYLQHISTTFDEHLSRLKELITKLDSIVLNVLHSELSTVVKNSLLDKLNIIKQLQNDCMDCRQKLDNIISKLNENKIDDVPTLMIIHESQKKCNILHGNLHVDLEGQNIPLNIYRLFSLFLEFDYIM
ncbi:unnamed protein product, partial [Didymodactylos carnosus]